MTHFTNSLNNPEAQPQAGAELGEFSPLVNPELALQTYESFAGGPERVASRQAFKTGSSYHLEMTYPSLDQADAAQKGQTLHALRAQAVDKYGPDSLTISSIDYRIQETEFLQVAAQFNAAAQAGDTENIQQLANQYVQLAEALYGKPDQAVIDAMLVDLKQRYTNSDPRVQNLWAMLESGFSVNLANGTEVVVPPLVIPKEAVRELPRLSDEASESLEKEWKLMFPAIVEAQGLIADIIGVKQGLGIDYDPTTIKFDGNNTKDVFTLAAQGIANHHGVEPFVVEQNQVGIAASWETARNAVVVAMGAKPRSWANMRQVGAHESMHGLKAANGLLSGEPAMATGVFSRNPDGTYTDYLTFEEGNNRLGETVLDDAEEENNIFASSYKYNILAGLVYRGFDDRQTKEVFSRLATIERLSLNPDLNESTVLQATADFIVTSIERFFRGTPTNADVTVDGHMPIFTKDIAYFNGRLIATEFWNQVATDATSQPNPREYFHEIFEIQAQGKVDPTDPVQYAAAKAAYQKRQF